MRRKSVGVDKDVLNTQLRAHYSLCIQLSNSNKINSTNAFGLHLIDHMDSVMRSLKFGNLNFKLASSTLDAGTKIYCSRVDSVHSEAQKVASALVNALDTQKSKGRAGAGDLEGEEPGGELDDGDGNPEARPGRQRKNKKKVKTVESAENLTISKVDNTIEFDQIFLKINSAFDMSSLDNLLVNNLQVDCNGQLIINSKSKWNEMQTATIVSHPESTDETNSEWCAFEIESLQNALKPDARICTRLENFRFDNRSEALEKAEESMFAFRDLPEDDVCDNNLFDDFGIGGDMPDNIGDAADYDFGMQNTEGDDDLPRMAKQELRSLDPSDLSHLMKLLSDKPSEYTYFDRKLINTWAGPNFWKSRHVNVAGAAKPVNTKKTKKTYEKISFDTYVDDVVFVPKESRKLSLPTFEKWMENKNQLPEYFWHEPIGFVKPFWKENFNNFKIKGISSITEITPVSSQESQAEAEGAHKFDINDDGPDNFDGVDHNQSTNSNFEMMPTEEYDVDLDTNRRLTGDNLIEQPYQIQHIDIPYAKFAKKVDVKRLKGLIWDVVQHPPDQTLNSSLAETQQSVSVTADLQYNVFSLTKSINLIHAFRTFTATDTGVTANCSK
jgi:condensin complex subunit 2